MRLIRSAAMSALLGACTIPALMSSAQAQVVITVGAPPPPLPIYEQPPIPAIGYIWTPGYWSYDDVDGYFWVPGTWILPPRANLLWTPGYWGFEGGRYGYHRGYWGDRVGFYGGVDYGFGYGGAGYEGGYWRDGRLFYNSSVNNFATVRVTNVYTRTIVRTTTVTRVSYNGGRGGLDVRPTREQEAFARQDHVEPTPVQREHLEMAKKDPALRESQNKGKPPIAATSKPNDFKGDGAVPAKEAGERPAGRDAPRGNDGAGSNAREPGPAKGQQPGETGANGKGAKDGAPDVRPGAESKAPDATEKGSAPEAKRARKSQGAKPGGADSDEAASGRKGRDPGAEGSTATGRGGSEPRQPRTSPRESAAPRDGAGSRQERPDRTMPREGAEPRQPRNEPRTQGEPRQGGGQRMQAEPRMQGGGQRMQGEPRMQGGGAPDRTGGGGPRGGAGGPGGGREGGERGPR